MTRTPRLQVRDLVVRYGGIEAVRSVDISVEPGEVVAIIGANGAGKSSLMNAVAGLVPASGEILLDGIDVSRKAPHMRSRLGIGLVPEGRQVFAELSVEDNLRAAAHAGDAASERNALAEMYDRFPALLERRRQAAATLSGGEQQMVALARALMTNPRVLLMDEPSMGLAPKIVAHVYSIIEDLRDKGQTILLVEQNAKKALDISPRAYVLELGRVVLAGSGDDLARNPDVRRAYLGV